MSIKPTTSRFFANDISSDSGSDGEEEGETLKNVSQIFCDFVKNPSIKPTTKKSDSLATCFRQYIKEDFEDRDIPSPTLLMRDYIREADPDTLIGSSGRKIFEEYVQRISLAPDSPQTKKRSSYLQDAYDLFSSKLSSAKSDTAEYHREALSNFFTVEEAVRGLKAIPCVHHHAAPPSFPPIINMVHIAEGEQHGTHSLGYHFDMQDSIEVNVRARNPVTGVFCGTFLREGCREKFSTFFPPSIDSETALVHVIQTAEKIAQKDNRFLYRTRTDIPFYIEKLFQEGGCIVQSAYPLFYYGEFVGGATFQITENSALTSAEILNALSCPPIVQEHTKYIVGDDVIVDIAPLFQDRTGVSAGVNVRFPRGLLPS